MKHRKWFLLLMIGLAMTLFLCGCGNNQTDAPASAQNEKSSDENYTKYTGQSSEGVDYYIDDSQLSEDMAIAADQKKIKDNVASYVLSLCAASQGRSGHVVDSDFISEPGLAHELDARYRYLAAIHQDENLSQTVPFLRYDQLDIQDDTAKVLVTYSLRNPENEKIVLEQQEGYVYVKDGRYWKLVNVIVDTGKGGAEMIDRLAKSGDPQEWRTTFAYSQLKRSDYEEAPDFSYYMGDDMVIDEAKIAEEK